MKELGYCKWYANNSDKWETRLLETHCKSCQKVSWMVCWKFSSLDVDWLVPRNCWFCNKKRKGWIEDLDIEFIAKINEQIDPIVHLEHE